MTPEDEIHDKEMSLLEHLAELRRRLLWSAVAFLIAFLISYHFAARIYDFLAAPLAHALEARGQKPEMIYTALYEAFFTYIKVSVFAAAFLSFPVIAVQLWLFIAPGLYKREKQAMLPFLVVTPILFFAGGALAYYVIFPTAWRFFLSFQNTAPGSDVQIDLMARVSDYLNLVMKLIFAFGLSFELPVLLTLARQGRHHRLRGLTQIPALRLCRLLHPRRGADPAGHPDPMRLGPAADPCFMKFRFSP